MIITRPPFFIASVLITALVTFVAGCIFGRHLGDERLKEVRLNEGLKVRVDAGNQVLWGLERLPPDEGNHDLPLARHEFEQLLYECAFHVDTVRDRLPKLREHGRAIGFLTRAGDYYWKNPTTVSSRNTGVPYPLEKIFAAQRPAVSAPAPLSH
jgi:hypothetical protein